MSETTIETIKPFDTIPRGPSPEIQGFKAFTVEDPDGLPLPGYASVQEVRLGVQDIPESIDHRVPTDATHRNFKTLRVYNWTLHNGVLLRGANSNDGKWQKGATVWVKGTLAAAPKAEKSA
jgi:hypothetical protein